MVNSKSLFGTGQLPKFAEDLFRCSDADAEAVARGEFKDNDHWLIPDRRGAGHQSLSRRDSGRDAAADLAYRLYALFSRRGRAAGKDTRGIIRQHQFQKVELVKFHGPKSPMPSTSA